MLLHCWEEVLGIQEGNIHHLHTFTDKSQFDLKKVLPVSSLHRKTLCPPAVQYFLTLTLSVASERLSVSRPCLKSRALTVNPNTTEMILNCCRLMSRLTSYPKMIHFHQANDHFSALQQYSSGSRGRPLGEGKWEMGATAWTHKSPGAERAQVEPYELPVGTKAFTVSAIFEKIILFFFKRPGKLHGNKKRHCRKEFSTPAPNPPRGLFIKRID